MKNHQEYQAIFNILIECLEGSSSYRSFYNTREIRRQENIETSLEYYLESVKKRLASDDIDDQFLTQVYNNVFHTGDVPKNCNHIMMTCDLSVGTGDTSPLFEFWLDLDKVTELVNSHFQINPPCRFEVKYGRGNTPFPRVFGEEGQTCVKDNRSYVVNSDYGRLERNNLFLMMSIVSGSISGFALLLVAKALTSLIIWSPMLIITATVGVVAGLASIMFFKSMDTDDYTTNVKSVVKSAPVNIDVIFEEHFAETINVWKEKLNVLKEKSSFISPKDRVVEIDENKNSLAM